MSNDNITVGFKREPKEDSHVFAFEIGDWSNDGHGHSKRIIIESNLSPKELTEHYEAVCRKIGFSISSNVPSNPDGSLSDGYLTAIRVGSDYGNLREEMVNKLKSFGWNRFQEWISEERGSMKVNTYVPLFPTTYLEFFEWFVNIEPHPDGEIYTVELELDLPEFNGWTGKHGDAANSYGFGYGCTWRY